MPPLLEAEDDPLPQRGRLSGLAGPGLVLAGAVLVPVIVPAVMVGPQVPARCHVLIRLIMDHAPEGSWSGALLIGLLLSAGS